MNFKYESYDSFDAVRHFIKECEGKHSQQAVFSTFHNALTQICFGCKVVRSNIQIFFMEGGENK